MVAGGAPRGQGRGRLGGRLHRVLHGLARRRRDALHLGPDVGRPRPAPPRARCATPPTPTARWRASSSRTRAPTARTARRGCRRRPRPRSRATTRTSPPRRWSSSTSTASCRTGWRPPSARATPGSTSSTSTAATPTCSGRCSRRSTTSAPTPTAARSRTAPGCGSRRCRPSATRSAPTARSPAGWPCRRPAARGWSWTRGSSSCAWPTTWSTCGTSTSARSWSGRRTRARRASSPRAGSSSGPGTCARRRSKPIVGVGRLTTPERMAEIIESGVWDLIGAARPNIADPFLPEKIRTGRIDDIRACIGCNMCISKGDVRRHIGCTQNATAGEEHRRGWHPERFDRAANADREVLVVGAGPAGMECALVLGRRGMRRVRLVDAADEPGGVTRWIPRLPGLGEWDRLRTWRLGQLAKLANVEIETGVHLDAAGVRATGADLVVIATGAEWAGDGRNGVTRGPIPGADAGPEARPHARAGDARGQAPARLAGAGARLRGLLHGRRDGRAAARPRPRGGARHLVREGRAALRRDARGPAASPPPARPRHPHAGRDVAHPDRAGRRGGRDRARRDVRARGRRGGARDPARLPRSASTWSWPRPASTGVYRIGDCVAPRLLADAIWDGHRLGREIDSPDPSRPLPHLRERPGFEAVPLAAAAR